MPWDDLYSILTPDMRFNMFFNHANFMHGIGAEAGQRDHGLRWRRRARAFLGASEEAMRDAFLADLDPIYPQVRRRIVETWVKVWEHAGPFAAPGRWRRRRRWIVASPTGSSWPATGSSRVRLHGDRRPDGGRCGGERASRARRRARDRVNRRIVSTCGQPGQHVRVVRVEPVPGPGHEHELGRRDPPREPA